LFGDQDVFEHVRRTFGSRVVRHPHHDVTGLVNGATTFPVAIRFVGNGTTRGALRGFHLLRAPASAHGLRTTRGTSQVATGRNKGAATFDTLSHRETISSTYDTYRTLASMSDRSQAMLALLLASVSFHPARGPRQIDVPRWCQ
jgi:hypothetical protein